MRLTTSNGSYCKQVYQTNPDPRGIFLTLLRIYLRPSSTASKSSLEPALDLISRHSPRLDSVEVLQLLPPLVNTSQLRTFLIESLKSPKVDLDIAKELWKSRSHQIDKKLITLQSRRVKIADSRMQVARQCVLIDSVLPNIVLQMSSMPQKIGEQCYCGACAKVSSLALKCSSFDPVSRGEVTHYQCREAFASKLPSISAR